MVSILNLIYRELLISAIYRELLISAVPGMARLGGRR